MRDTNLTKSEPLVTEYIPMELQRITEEEFEMWDQEPCIASAD
jgi:hypothetical protein